VDSSLDRLHPLPEADSVVRRPGPHLLGWGGRTEALLQVRRAVMEQSSKPAGTGDRCGARPGGSQPVHSCASPSHDRSPCPGGCCIRSPITRDTNLCTTPRCKIKSVATHPGHDGTTGAASKPTAARPAASKAATSRWKCPA
jgi:hypothetical protein